jgi:hypothetical protein
MDELQSGPLMVKSLMGRRFMIELSLKWNNEMKISEFVSETILDGKCLSCHLVWYVECHITPHGLRVMALQRWRTHISRLEAPKGQKSQRDCKE